MKIATLIAQVLVGLEFVVFGLNPFLHFLPATLPPGLGGQFLSILFESKYVLFVGAVQVIGGALLIINRYVPLALTLLAPVLFNILLFHGLLSHAGWQPGVVTAILWIFLMFRYKKSFVGIFEAKPAI
jgi:putative oxidoreductase